MENEIQRQPRSRRGNNGFWRFWSLAVISLELSCFSACFGVWIWTRGGIFEILKIHKITKNQQWHSEIKTSEKNTQFCRSICSFQRANLNSNFQLKTSFRDFFWRELTASWHFGGMSKRPGMCRVSYFRERTCQETSRGAQAVAHAPRAVHENRFWPTNLQCVIWAKR